ncbi:phage holin [Lacticaseibacillus sp. 866-1]|uniref:phage holin n=1 Tax=Lacticaseibacillus sp. 866-1 TaxID=2799576 RepID=UPI0035B52C43
MMNNLSNLIVSIAVAVIPIIAAYVSKEIVANKNAMALIQTIGPLAKAAVAAAEALGVTKGLDGAAKKSKAVQSVVSGLKKLGFNKTDEQTVADAVEKAFADSKDQLHAVYQPTSTTTTTEGSKNEDSK